MRRRWPGKSFTYLQRGHAGHQARELTAQPGHLALGQLGHQAPGKLADLRLRLRHPRRAQSAHGRLRATAGLQQQAERLGTDDAP